MRVVVVMVVVTATVVIDVETDGIACCWSCSLVCSTPSALIVVACSCPSPMSHVARPPCRSPVKKDVVLRTLLACCWTWGTSSRLRMSCSCLVSIPSPLTLSLYEVLTLIFSIMRCYFV